MRLLFLPILTSVIVVGSATVALPQVAVRVVAPVVVVPQVVVPQVVVPFPFFGGFYEGQGAVYAYGQRGHESRERAHHSGGGHGGRR